MSTSKKAPGKSYRKGISLIEAAERFGDPIKAEAWLVKQRWPDGIRCVECDSDAISPRKASSSRKTPQYRCRVCRKDFTVKTGTVMEDSKLTLDKWAIAFYLSTTNLKGVASMKLLRELGITQKTAWFLGHRIRETWNDETGDKFVGPVEVDETFIGGKQRNKHGNKKLAGRGTVGKSVVAGAKDRETNRVSTAVVPGTDRVTLHEFIGERTAEGAMLYTDDHPSYVGLANHTAVRHSVSEYVDGMAHTNGIESHWAMLKRGYHGVYHQMSAKHLQQYVTEFTGRHNARPLDTEAQMAMMAKGTVGKRLRYQDLVR